MKAKPANVELVAKYESSKAGGTGGGKVWHWGRGLPA